MSGWLYNIDDMADDINVVVVDLETTGLAGWPYDYIVNVGVVGVDLYNGVVVDLYSSNVGYPEAAGWPSRLKDSWIFRNGMMTLQEVINGPAEQSVMMDLQKILRKFPATSYNVNFDFGRFLDYKIISTKQLCCLMEAAAQCPLIPKDRKHETGKSYPKLETCYNILCPDDPADVDGKQKHLGLEDARMAGHVLIKLMDMGYWSTWKHPGVCL